MYNWIVKAVMQAAKNMNDVGKTARETEPKGYNIEAVKNQPGIKTQSSPAISTGAESPTAKVFSMMGGPPVQFQRQFPVASTFVKGEESMLRGVEVPSVGGYTVQPQSFDSSEQFYRPRRMY